MNIERPALQRGRCGQTNEEHPVLLLRGLSPCAIASERRSRGALKTRLRRGVARATRAARAWPGAGFWAVRGEPKRHDETSNKTSKGEVLFFRALAWAASTSLSTSLIGPEREVGGPWLMG